MELLGGYFVQKLEKLLPVNKDKNAIVFCIDENYVKYFGVVLQSFISHINVKNIYDLLVLHKDICVNSQNKLQSILPENVSLRFYNIENAREMYFKNITLKTKNYWSESTYYRLLIPMIFSNYEKVLYCDSDIICDNSIDSIFFIPSENKGILAIADSFSQELLYDKKRYDYMINYLKINPKKYFNAGVVLFNIKNIELKDYSSKLYWVFNNLDNLLFLDQDILNVIFENNVKFISLKYNFQLDIPTYNFSHFQSYDKSFMDDLIISEKEPIIIHFSMSEKPWDFPQMIYSKKFWCYARKSPFYEEIIYDNYNKKLKLLAYKDDIYRKYLCSKILSKLTFGDIQKKLVKKRNDLKQKVRNIRIFLRGV